MDVWKVLEGLDKAVGAVEALTPVIGAVGGSAAADVAKIATAAASIASNVLERAKEGKAVLASKDEAFVRDAIAKLAKANDGLAAAIDNS